MKQRTGFVSNSSSSSFLITVNKINNNDDLNDIIKDYNPTTTEIDECTEGLVLMSKHQIEDYFKCFGHYSNNFFESDFAGGVYIDDLKGKMKDGEYFLCLSNSNEQGDNAYRDEDGWVDYYNISESNLLEQNILKVLRKINKDKRLTNIGYNFKAGRNG